MGSVLRIILLPDESVAPSLCSTTWTVCRPSAAPLTTRRCWALTDGAIPLRPCVRVVRPRACASPSRSAVPSRPVLPPSPRRLLETCWCLGRRGRRLSRLTHVLRIWVVLGRGHQPKATRRPSGAHLKTCTSRLGSHGPACAAPLQRHESHLLRPRIGPPCATLISEAARTSSFCRRAARGSRCA